MPEKKEIIEKYIAQLNETEKKAYEIAKKRLESSFDVEKSIGFLKWVQKNNL